MSTVFPAVKAKQKEKVLKAKAAARELAKAVRQVKADKEEKAVHHLPQPWQRE